MIKKIVYALFCGLLCTTSVQAKDQITIEDLSGRKVQVSVPVKHIVLGEGRYLPTLGIFDQDDPTKRVVGMMGEFEKYDLATYSQYAEHYPQIRDIPRIGSAGEASFSIEKVFSVKPDVALFGLGSGHGPNDKSKTVIAQMEAAGIPVIILDFRIDPLKNTPKSLKILGKIMGNEKTSDAFLSFYHTHLKTIEDRLKDVKERPTVFMESHVGLLPQCCRAFGQQMMGRFIEWAGGVNAFGEMIPGTVAQVNIEHLLTKQPDVYIGTAIGSSKTVEKFPKYIALGAQTGQDMAQSTLEEALKRTGVAQLSAVKEGRAHAIWHHFYNTPMNLVAVEVIAKWLHPELFKDIDPYKTLKVYFDRFQAVPLDGTYWTSRLTKDAS
ncbi:MAG: ABC transporter substrate-binding protein [Methylocystaceae bacterium]|nr:ABC transporter substrate-binding protein [Methylocystaceae bacterium]